MALSPTVLWAQTKDAVYMTVELDQSDNLSVDITDDSISLTASRDGKDYAFDFSFYKPIKSGEVMRSSDRFVRFKLPKVEPGSWPTLNSCGKKHFIRCDWDRWVDSDGEAGDLLDGGFDMSSFGGDFGDFDGLGNADDDEDDFEDSEEDEEDDYCGYGSFGKTSKGSKKTDDESGDASGGPCSNPKCKCTDCECGASCNCGSADKSGSSCSAKKCGGSEEHACSGEPSGKCKNPDCKCTPCDCDDERQCGYRCICDEACVCDTNCRCSPSSGCSPKCHCSFQTVQTTC